MASRIGIVDRGRLIAEGTLDELRLRLGESGATLEAMFLHLTAQSANAA